MDLAILAGASFLIHSALMLRMQRESLRQRGIVAVGHWTRSQGELLGVSGFLLGAAAFALLFLPVLRLRASTRRFMGLPVTAYTVVSVSAAMVLAVVLALIAVTIPLE